MGHFEAASVQFLKWSPLYDEEKPFQIFLDRDLDAEGHRTTNLSWEERNIEVEDFRNRKDFEDIDSHGFTSRSLNGFDIMNDIEAIERDYLPAVETLLRKTLNDVGTVFIFDWRIRDSDAKYDSGQLDFSDLSKSLLPSNFAHIDMTPISVISRIRKSFPDDAKAIFQQRIRAINVWKPLGGVVDQWSLAVCDGNTVPSVAMIETDQVRKDAISSLYYAIYSKDMKWYFLHQQLPKEVLIFKHFDSKSDVRASFAMHASIKQHKTPANPRPRKSIEIRTLVFEGQFIEKNGQSK